MAGKSEQYFMADLYGELQLAPAAEERRWTAPIPGLLLVAVTGFAALWLAQTYGAPPILIGLLLGFALNFTSADARLQPGLDFASQTLLRIGIVLLGLRVTIGEVAELGLMPFLGLLAVMSAVIAVGMLSARVMRLDVQFGLLAGGATAICGVSAALALWGIIGSKRVDREGFAITVLGVTLASALGLATYPALAAMLDLTDTQAGYLIGASVHDVAQAIGGGFAVSENAGEVATVVKLSRVALLVPVLLSVSLFLGRKSEGKRFSLRQGLPWFIVGFVLLVTLNSIVSLPEVMSEAGASLAGFFLLLAVTSAAIKADLSGIMAHGWRSFVPVASASLTAFLLALSVALVL